MSAQRQLSLLEGRRRPENHMRPIAQFVWNGERPEQGGRRG